MLGHGRGSRLHGLGAAGLLALTLLATSLWVPDQASASTTPTRTTSTFELLPDSNLIHVTVVYSVTNKVPSTTATVTCTQYYWDPNLGMVPYTTTCTRTTSYYMNAGQVPVDPDGVHFRATTSGGGATVSVASAKKGYLPNATLRFPNTYYGTTRTVTLTYDIPGGAPRSGRFTRAGQAYASFCGFPAGGDTESFRLIVPERYEVNPLSGATLTRSLAADKAIWSGPETTGSQAWQGACVEAVNAAAYATADFTSPSSQLSVRVLAWPEDKEWMSAISSSVGTALDNLETVIGQPPATRSITVRETVSEDLSGYAADFDPATSTARVSEDALDSDTAAHELAHAWFNEAFSPARWLDEGYAEYEARTSLASTGAAPCTLATPSEAGTVHLANWFFLPAVPTATDQARVAAEYDVSCWVVTQVAQRVGPAAMRDIYAAAVDGQIPYVGSGTPEHVHTGPITWQNWLDLADERGLAHVSGTDLNWLQDLLVQTGVATTSALGDRADLRAAYHDLLSTTTPWAAPYAVRLPMARWEWNGARDAIKAASSAYQTHAAAVKLVPELQTSKTVESAYEASQNQQELAATDALASQELASARAVARAVTVAKAGRNPIEWVGLVGEDLGKDATRAVSALVGGRFQEATDVATKASESADGAALAGGLRLGGVVIVGGLGGAMVLIRRRRGRARVDSASSPGEAPDGSAVAVEEPMSGPDDRSEAP